MMKKREGTLIKRGGGRGTFNGGNLKRKPSQRKGNTMGAGSREVAV